MKYTSEERTHIETVLAAFRDYIIPNPNFDIIYSEKCGYLYLTLEGELVTGERILIADNLLGILFHEISCDVRDQFLCGEHFDFFLYPREIEEVRTLIKHYLDQLPDVYRTHGNMAMEFYINHCNDNPILF